MRFNGESEEDHYLMLIEKQIMPPSKKKIKYDVPYADSVYDFSTVSTMGEPVYSQRIITCKFAVLSNSKQDLQTIYTLVLEWLMSTGQQKIEFDEIPGYYYLGEVENSPDWKEIVITGEMTVTFVCEPYKYSVDLAGYETWDTFNFLIDYLQDVSFTVNGTTQININNPGKNVVPWIVCSSPMTISIRGYSVNLAAGEQRNWGVNILKGDNTITVSGNGTIEFKFRKELL